jgi:putative membrane protein
MSAPTQNWTRLDARMVIVAPAHEALRFLPLLIVALIAGGSDNRQWWLLGTVSVLMAFGVLRWITTRYRVTPERLELHTGLLFRQHRSVPRDRVRTVDVTAKPLHRLFRLSVVRVGTGQHESGRDRELALDAVSAAEAERLRAVLLDRAPVPIEVAAAQPTGQEIARLHWSWLRFAPLTVWSVASVVTLAGSIWGLLAEAGVRPTDIGTIRGIAQWLAQRPVAATVAVIAGSLLLLGIAGSVVLYAEAWWHYRLTREPDGTLRVNRGLLTKRSVSLEERRLRGVQVDEPLLLRAARAARCNAVATGSGGGERSKLLPPATGTETHRVAAVVLREPTPPTTQPLLRHPPAALRRRLTRALIPYALIVAGLVAADRLSAWMPPWPWQAAAVVLLPASVLLGIDRYRNLGHLVTEQYLLVRSGSLLRQTVVLRRSGIIGWRVSRSVFQRASGLATVTAVTAAGAGAYHVVDVSIEEAVRLVS